MSIHHGGDVTVEVGDGGDPEVYSEIEGARVTRLYLRQQATQNGGPASGIWRQSSNPELVELSLSCEGVYIGGSADTLLLTRAFSGQAGMCRLNFPDGIAANGEFMIVEYERYGEYGEEEQFRVSLESIGSVTLSGI